MRPLMSRSRRGAETGCGSERWESRVEKCSTSDECAEDTYSLSRSSTMRSVLAILLPVLAAAVVYVGLALGATSDAWARSSIVLLRSILIGFPLVTPRSPAIRWPLRQPRGLRHAWPSRGPCHPEAYGDRGCLIALELPHDGGAGQQLKLRFEPDDSGRQVFDLYLLHLERIGLARHLVLEFDHRGEGTLHALGDTHQAAFRLLRLALASNAAMRLLLSSINSSALSIDALARSAAAVAASAKAPSSLSASVDL